MTGKESGMEIRVVEIAGFKVSGYKLKGPFVAIPSKWEELKKAVMEHNIEVNESFGVCMAVKDNEIEVWMPVV